MSLGDERFREAASVERSRQIATWKLLVAASDSVRNDVVSRTPVIPGGWISRDRRDRLRLSPDGLRGKACSSRRAVWIPCVLRLRRETSRRLQVAKVEGLSRITSRLLKRSRPGKGFRADVFVGKRVMHVVRSAFDGRTPRYTRHKTSFLTPDQHCTQEQSQDQSDAFLRVMHLHASLSNRSILIGKFRRLDSSRLGPVSIAVICPNNCPTARRPL